MLISLMTAGLMVTGLMLGASAWEADPRTNVVEVPYPPGKENMYLHHVYRAEGTARAFRLGYSTPHQGDTRPGAQTYKMWYQVSSDGGDTFDEFRPLIQRGDGFDRMHPIRPVYVPHNSYVASVPPPSRASNGEVMVPFWFWPLDEYGRLAHVNDRVHTFSAVGVLVGRWTEDGRDLTWDLGATVHLDHHTQSRRGAMEPAVVELQEPGHFLMIIRGSNSGAEDVPGYKWKAVSTDFCRTWTQPEPFTYCGGKPFFSPSASSDIRRSSVNQKLYWFGNITPTNPDGNMPRYPLVVGEVDENTLTLIPDSVKVLDTRDEAKGDTEQVQFSNFVVEEDPANGAFVVTLTRLDGGRRIANANPPWAGVDWPQERYVVELSEE